MPFTSNLVGKFSANPLAVDIFAVNLLAAMLGDPLFLYLRLPQQSGYRRIPAGNAGCTAARGGKRIRHRRVDRHCVGEHRCRQILLAAACRRASARRSLVC